MRNMDNERLIELVYQRKQLWDVRDRNYHNRDFSRKLWNEIATELQCTSHLVKSKWQNLRDTYRKEYMKLINSSGDASKGPHWKYFDRLAFLNDVLALRKKPTPSGLSSGKRSSSRRSSANAGNSKLDESAADFENDDVDEYTDINPLRYLCEVPQVIPEEHDDTSSIQDTVSNDAHSATDNQDSNNNNGGRASIFDVRKSASIIKKKMSTVPLETVTPMEDDSGPHHYQFNDFEMQHDQCEIFNTIGASNINSRASGRGPPNYDEDYHFLMSVLPHLREIPKNRKLQLRQKLQQVILDEQQLQSPLKPSNAPQVKSPAKTAQPLPPLPPQTQSEPQSKQTTDVSIKEEEHDETQSENEDNEELDDSKAASFKITNQP